MLATMNIEYNVKENTFNITGDVKESAWAEILEAWISSQIGSGKDSTPAVERDVYHIQILWRPEDDGLSISSDTGNKGLREGILMYILSQLTKKEDVGAK